MLPVFVREAAWVAHGWLDMGFALWEKAPLNYKRDYFLPLPDKHLSGVLQRRALYTDSAGFSVGLVSSLAAADCTALVPHGGAQFWSEHSDRSGLDSWCAALGFEESQRGFLGRWAARRSADCYVRTALRVTENLQVAAASHARFAFNGGPDFFGEEEILKGFEHHLRDHGLAPEEAARAAEGLRTADYKANPTVTLDPQREVRARRAPAGVAPDEIKRVPAEDAELEAGLREAAAETPDKEVVPWGFVVSITRNGRHRKLHHIGDCRLIPGVHYRDFEVWGGKLPGEREIDSRCGWCFPASDAKGAPGDEPESDGGSDSSSSSSVGSVSPKRQRA